MSVIHCIFNEYIQWLGRYSPASSPLEKCWGRQDSSRQCESRRQKDGSWATIFVSLCSRPQTLLWLLQGPVGATDAAVAVIGACWGHRRCCGCCRGLLGHRRCCGCCRGLLGSQTCCGGSVLLDFLINHPSTSH